MKTKPLSQKHAQAIASQHKQLRSHSCFQSAPELWLKLKGVIRAHEYPEQSNPLNDGKGYGPYPDKGIKVYGRKRVWFEKAHFDFPYIGMHERFSSELNKGNPIVVSVLPNPGEAHGYLLYAQAGAADYLLISKTSPSSIGPSVTIEDLLSRFTSQKQTIDCLFMSRPGDL